MFAMLDATVPALPAGPAALSDGGRQARRSRRRGACAASTCSIACCRRARAAPRRPSPGTARVNLRNARHADDPRAARPANAAARPAPATAAPICTISCAAARSSARMLLTAAQSALLCRSDGGDARGDRGRRARRFRRRLRRDAGAATSRRAETAHERRTSPDPARASDRAAAHRPTTAVLETVPTRIRASLYLVRFTCPEFTALCPVTGQPDFAHLVIDYVPEAAIVESKSLKLFLGAFRNHGAFHEDCTLGIARRLVAALGAALAAHRRLLVSARRHPDRRVLSDRRAARRAVAARPRRRALSRPRLSGWRGRDPRGDPRRGAGRGFDAVGFAAAALEAEARAGSRRVPRPRLSRRHGLARRHRRAARRPAGLWPEVRPSSCSGVNYAPEDDPLAALDAPDRGAVSVYARGRDYHDTLKRRLKALAHWIDGQWPGALKLFVDTAPVMEKPLAQQAGIGWQGKHTNLVSREFGSWLFLGEIYLSLGARARRRRARPLRRLPALSRRLPDRRVSRALPARRAALHLVPDDRAQGHDPARVSRR